MLLPGYVLASDCFAERLRAVRPDQWNAPTPCSEWDVRALVNHMTRGNLNYAALLDGATRDEFLAMREVDALGADPVAAFVRSAQQCASAFAVRDGFTRVLDYPFGPVTGQQALAIRTTDSVVHTWDLARAVGADERLDAGLVRWVNDNVENIYAPLAGNLRRFFAAPPGEAVTGASAQDLLLRRLGRTPG